MTLAELIAERRAKIEVFETDTRVSAFHDISEVNDLIERTPIVSKADALAALDLIRDETIEPGHHLVIVMITALRRYIEKA
jgi:hypothetical protein